jgi:ribosomal protein S6--L-glutamate ligase
MSTRLILGWQEWIALPQLGLPALKAKIDTGAKTSALHTHLIEPFGTLKRPMVRFTVRPNPKSTDLEIAASAPVIDRREVRSSNGERQLRFVIATQVQLGTYSWPIEVTLTNREQMSYRMLLGRQAIRSNVLVDPDASFRQPRLSYTLYDGK